MDFTDYNFDYNYNGGGGGANSGDTNNNNNNNVQSPHSQTDVLTNYRCVLLNYPVNSSSTYPILSYYSLWFINHNPLYPPTDFTPIHHVAFQVAQLIFLVYLTVIRTHSGTGILLLTIYCVVQLLWGVLVLKSIDLLFWNSLNLLVLVIQCARLCFCGGGGSPHRGSSRRVKSSSKASLVSPSSTGKNSEIDMVYNKLFAPVRVSYKQFLRVVSCKRGFSVLGCGENYALEKRTRVDSLGLLVGGRLVVSQAGKPLHVILPFQFVDSPEYFGVATDELFQVTITALEESKLLVWHRDKLRLTIMNDEFLRVMFDHIIGRDVVRKLIQVSDTIMTTTTTTSCTTTSLFTTTPTSPSHNNGQPGNGSTPSGLLTTLTSGGGGGQNSGSCNPGGVLTTTTMMTPNPILMVTRKDKYAYSSSYLTALSEERKVQNGYGVEEEEDDDEEEEEEEEEDVEAEEEMPNEEENGGGVLISGNEKEPMLANGNGAEA